MRWRSFTIDRAQKQRGQHRCQPPLTCLGFMVLMLTLPGSASGARGLRLSRPVNFVTLRLGGVRSRQGEDGLRIACPKAKFADPVHPAWRFRDRLLVLGCGSLPGPKALLFAAASLLAKAVIRRRASRCICGSPGLFRGELTGIVFRYCCGLRRRLFRLLFLFSFKSFLLIPSVRSTLPMT